MSSVGASRISTSGRRGRDPPIKLRDHEQTSAPISSNPRHLSLSLISRDKSPQTDDDGDDDDDDQYVSTGKLFFPNIEKLGVERDRQRQGGRGEIGEGGREDIRHLIGG